MNSLNQNPSNPDTHEIRPLVLKNNTLTEPPSTFRVLSCIDMDAFFAQAEARRFGYDDTVPLVVIHFRVCIAVTYAARKYGVTRIMPIDEIKKLCPHIILVHVDTIKVGQEPIDPYKRDLKDKLNINRKWDQEKTCLDYYRFESDKVFAILKRMCPIVEKASIDENFLDFTEEAMRIYNTGNYEVKWEGKVPGYEGKIPETKEEILLMIGSQIAAKIRKEVHDTLKYTCTAGIPIIKCSQSWLPASTSQMIRLLSSSKQPWKF